MVVPNVFTPNGDNLNDEFKLLEYQKELQNFHIWVYDRWGNKVYESTDKDFVWDGTDIFAGNKPLKTAVFTYAIEYTLYNQPDKKIKGGNISLIK
jgi:gliding motility-associated-like protein